MTLDEKPPTTTVTKPELNLTKSNPSPQSLVTKIGSSADTLSSLRRDTVTSSREFISSLLDLPSSSQLETVIQPVKDDKRVITSNIDNDNNTKRDEHIQKFEPYSRRELNTKDEYQSNEELELYDDERNERRANEKPRSTGTVPKGTVTPVQSSSENERSSSSLSHHRKSVSFDLPDPEPAQYTYRLSSDSDDDNDNIFSDTKNQDAVSGSRNFAKPPIPQSSSEVKSEVELKRPTVIKPIKGILRATSPALSQQQQTGSIASWIRSSQEHLSEQEIDQENPFKKEFESKSGEEDVIVHAYPVKVRPQTTYEPLGDQESKIPLSRPVFASTGNLATDRAKPKPPIPPKPQKLKEAELVSNQGLNLLRHGLEKGDYVEYEHDPITNTVKEVTPDRDSFSPDNPLPPIPVQSSMKSRIPQLTLTQRSIERPKVSPPPPPTPKTPIIVDADLVEIVPARYETLPKVEQAKVAHENSKENILVTDEIHRRILLQENELRNALSDGIISDTNNNFNAGYEVSSQYSSIQSSSHSKIPVLQPNSVFPTTQVLPVHYTQLPTPQQPGLIRTIVRDQPVQLCQPGNSYSGNTVMLVSSNPQRIFSVPATTQFERHGHTQMNAMHGHLLHQWSHDNTITSTPTSTSTNPNIVNNSYTNNNSYLPRNPVINTLQTVCDNSLRDTFNLGSSGQVDGNVKHQILPTTDTTITVTKSPALNSPLFVTNNNYNNPSNSGWLPQNSNQVIYVQTQYVPVPGTAFIEQIESSGTSRSSSVSTITSLPPNLPTNATDTGPVFVGVNIDNESSLSRTSFINEPSPTMTTFGKQTQV